MGTSCDILLNVNGKELNFSVHYDSYFMGIGLSILKEIYSLIIY
jgi:hypothetical protein